MATKMLVATGNTIATVKGRNSKTADKTQNARYTSQISV